MRSESYEGGDENEISNGWTSLPICITILFRCDLKRELGGKETVLLKLFRSTDTQIFFEAVK